MNRRVIAFAPDDHIRGPKDAPHKLIEYGDFECPHCQAAHWELKRLEVYLGDRLALAFRHFPLTQAHPHASLAAEAAEAAAAQGCFWEMHDSLFENQQALEPEDMMERAERLGLELRRFAIDLQDHRFVERVHHDFLSGVRGGVNGTPCFFLNGMRREGVFRADELAVALEGAESGESLH